MQGGMLPLNLFSDKSIESRFVALQRKVGIDPLKLLLEKDKIKS